MPLVTIDEVRLSGKRIKPRKAPGTDGIPTIVMKAP